MSEEIKIAFGSRREFFRTLLIGFGAVGTSKLNWIWAAAAKKEEAVPAGKKAVPESDSLASQLGYKEDASKVDVKKFPQLNTAAGKLQNCANCMFYTPENGSWGKCQLIQSGLVKGKGWCMSWAKKA